MNLPPDYRLVYVVSSEAWFSRAVRTPHIYIRANTTSGSRIWEFPVKESDLPDEQTVIVSVSDDAFVAFTQIPEFFTALAEEKPTTLDEVRAILNRIGAVDTTERTRPVNA